MSICFHASSLKHRAGRASNLPPVMTVLGEFRYWKEQLMKTFYTVRQSCAHSCVVNHTSWAGFKVFDCCISSTRGHYHVYHGNWWDSKELQPLHWNTLMDKNCRTNKRGPVGDASTDPPEHWCSFVSPLCFEWFMLKFLHQYEPLASSHKSTFALHWLCRFCWEIQWNY